MKIINKLIAAFFLLVSFWCSATEVIRISYFAVEPHIFFDPETNQLTGALYELLENHISPAMGYKFEWDESTVNVPRQIVNLKDGVKDASAVMFYNAERAQQVTFSDTPWFYSKGGLAMLKSYPLNAINNIGDIIGLLLGTRTNTYVIPFLKDERIIWSEVTQVNFIEINLKKLMLGRIDAAYAAGTDSLLYHIEKLKLQDEVKILEIPFPALPFYVAFSPSFNPQIIDAYNRAFKNLEADKLYLELLKKYIDLQPLKHLQEIQAAR